MEYEITTRNNMRIEVFDTPFTVATWIADHLPELDYIQESDIAELSRAAVAVALRRTGVKSIAEFLGQVADAIADMEPETDWPDAEICPQPEVWPKYQYTRLVCLNGLKPLVRMALYHATHNDRPWDYREKCDPLRTSSFIGSLSGLRWQSENFACAVGGRIRDYHRKLNASRLPQ